MFAFPTRVTDDFLYSMLALTRLLCSIHQSANITDARSWHQLWELAGTRTNPTRSGLWWSGSTWWWDCGIFSWWLKKLQLQKHQQTPFLLSIWQTCCRMSLQNCKLYDQVWELPICWALNLFEEYKNTNSTNQKIPELLDTESNQPGCKCTKTTNILLFRLDVYFIFWEECSSGVWQWARPIETPQWTKLHPLFGDVFRDLKEAEHTCLQHSSCWLKSKSYLACSSKISFFRLSCSAIVGPPKAWRMNLHRNVNQHFSGISTFAYQL